MDNGRWSTPYLLDSRMRKEERFISLVLGSSPNALRVRLRIKY